MAYIDLSRSRDDYYYEIHVWMKASKPLDLSRRKACYCSWRRCNEAKNIDMFYQSDSLWMCVCVQTQKLSKFEISMNIVYVCSTISIACLVEQPLLYGLYSENALWHADLPKYSLMGLKWTSFELVLPFSISKIEVGLLLLLMHSKIRIKWSFHNLLK